jgi:hypothetical protein
LNLRNFRNASQADDGRPIGNLLSTCINAASPTV